jgi:pSer/pThr/pTyr-binding forkhead associated (FHA) protein
MTKETDKTIRRDKVHKAFGHATTTELSRKAFIGELPIKQRACLEIIGFGGKRKVIELGQGQLSIGRVPDCEIQLSPTKVSRIHARVLFRNEEYHLEDLGSTNGTYVNGIKIVKCVLRNNDQIDIGGVKILFSEEKALEKT